MPAEDSHAHVPTWNSHHANAAGSLDGDNSQTSEVRCFAKHRRLVQHHSALQLNTTTQSSDLHHLPSLKSATVGNKLTSSWLTCKDAMPNMSLIGATCLPPTPPSCRAKPPQPLVRKRSSRLSDSLPISLGIPKQAPTPDHNSDDEELLGLRFYADTASLLALDSGLNALEAALGSQPSRQQTQRSSIDVQQSGVISRQRTSQLPLSLDGSERHSALSTLPQEVVWPGAPGCQNGLYRRTVSSTKPLSRSWLALHDSVPDLHRVSGASPQAEGSAPLIGTRQSSISSAQGNNLNRTVSNTCPGSPPMAGSPSSLARRSYPNQSHAEHVHLADAVLPMLLPQTSTASLPGNNETLQSSYKPSRNCPVAKPSKRDVFELSDPPIFENDELEGIWAAPEVAVTSDTLVLPDIKSPGSPSSCNKTSSFVSSFAATSQTKGSQSPRPGTPQQQCASPAPAAKGLAAMSPRNPPSRRMQAHTPAMDSARMMMVTPSDLLLVDAMSASTASDHSPVEEIGLGSRCSADKPDSSSVLMDPVTNLLHAGSGIMDQPMTLPGSCAEISPEAELLGVARQHHHRTQGNAVHEGFGSHILVARQHSSSIK